MTPQRPALSLPPFAGGVAPARDLPAVIGPDGRRLTWGELQTAVDERAEGLPRDWPESSVVALSATSSVDLLIALLAVRSRGWVPLPLDRRLPLDARRQLAEHARAVALQTDDDRLEVDDAPLPAPAGVELVLPTVCAGGIRRLVALTTTGVRRAVEALATELPVGPAPRIGVVTSLASASGLIGQALPALHFGGTLILADTLDWPSAQLDVLFREGVTALTAGPSALRRLADAALDRPPAERPSLTLLVTTGAPVDATTLHRVRRAFPGARLFIRYGLTESAGRGTCVELDPDTHVPGRVGRPLADMEIRISPEGRVQLRGVGVMQGYLHARSVTAKALPADADGFLDTPDRGRLDATGCLHVMGRTDDLVRRGDTLVSLDAVAKALGDAPGILLCHVIAAPDARGGLRLVAFLVAELPADTLLPELRRFARARLTPAELPSALIVLDALPRLAEGEVDEDRLQAEARRHPVEPEPVP